MPSDATITIIGHIGEPKFQQAGEHLTARFGLATSRKRKGSELTTWWNCTVWRKDAEFIQKYAKKGHLLMVMGDAYEEEYEGKKYLKVEAKKVMILTPRGDSDATPAGDADTPTIAKAKERERVQTVPEDETIPF